MENASKVLLIAAGVLIVILIVTVVLRLFNSANGVAESGGKVGETVATETTESSDELINILEKNLVRIKDKKVTIENDYYKDELVGNYNVLLEYNTTYKLTFDYNVINTDEKVIYCSIGCGETKGYKKDLTYKIYYDNRKNTAKAKGTCEIIYTFNETNMKKPYLRLRLVRMDRKGNCEVEISNVIFKKVE